MEEFGKLFLLKDYLKAKPVGDQHAVDKSVFKKHDLKFDRALEVLPKGSLNRFKSVIVTIGSSKPLTMSGIGRMHDVGKITIQQYASGTFTDTQAPISEFTVSERVKGFLVDWDDDASQWSNEVQTESGRVQISVAPWDLLKIIDYTQTFVKAYLFYLRAFQLVFQHLGLFRNMLRKTGSME